MGPEKVNHLPGMTQQIYDGAPPRPPSTDLRFPVQASLARKHNMSCSLQAHGFFCAFQNGFPRLLSGLSLALGIWTAERPALVCDGGMLLLTSVGAGVKILASGSHCQVSDLEVSLFSAV